MFTIDDLWRIMDFLKDGTTDSRLSELTTTLATSEKELTSTFFEQVLDQETFNSEDYRRLRAMLVDWYSSHKTIATTQKYASDVHQLPNDHLSELFKSFGFPLGLDLVPLTSKANFFLDLVNFYKKKGTPETLVDVLDYYGFSDTDLVEYWLQKDQFGNIVFRGESVRTAATGSTLLLDSNVPFEKLTGSDPHWFQSKTDIENLILSNKINLPSKSPYYSLSSIFSLFSITISMTILFRIVQDQYDRFVLGQELPYNVPVKNLGMVLPILHVYIGSVYAFEKMFGHSTATSFTNYGCYDGEVEYKGDPPIPLHLSDLIEEYETLIARPISRLDRDTRLEELLNSWSRPLSENFLNSIQASKPLLEVLNPSFKAVIDSWFDIGDQNYLITYLIGTLDNWIRANIDSKSPSLVITMLGLGFREELDAIINFFKPYRARLAFMDTSFAIQNPLAESVLLDEKLITSIEGFYHDAIRPLNFDGDFCSTNGFSGTSWLHKLCGVDGPEPEPPPPELPDPDEEDWYLDEFGNPQFRYDLGASFDRSPHTQMDQDYLDELEANDPDRPPEPEPEPLDWIYDDDDNGKLMYRYDLETTYDVDPDSQMDLDYRERLEAVRPPDPNPPVEPEPEYPGPGFAGYCSAYRWDMDTYFDIPPVEQMDDDFYERLGEYLQSLHIGTICDYTTIDIDLSFVDVIGGNEGGSFDYGDYDTGAFYDVTSYWVDSVKIFFGQEVHDPIELDDIFIIQFDVEAHDDFGKEWPTQMDVGAGFDRMVTKSPVSDYLEINVSSVASAHCTTDVGGNYRIFDVGGQYDSLAELIIGVPEPLSGTASCRLESYVHGGWLPYDDGGMYDTDSGLVIGHYELTGSTANITSEVTIEEPDIYVGLYSTVVIESTYGGVYYNYDTGAIYDSIADLDLGVETALTGSSNSFTEATTFAAIRGTSNTTTNVFNSELVIGAITFMSSRPFISSYVYMILDIQFGVIEEMSSSISFNTLSQANVFIIGTNEILTSNINLNTDVDSELILGNIEEHLSSSISTDIDILSDLRIDALKSTSNVITTTSLSDLTIGLDEELTGIISVGTYASTSQSLRIGWITEELSSTVNVISLVNNISTIGIIEVLSSSIDITTNITSEMIVGNNETLTSIVNVECVVTGAFYEMIRGTASCGTMSSSDQLVFGIAKELLSSANAANTVTDADLIIGGITQISGTVNNEINIVSNMLRIIPVSGSLNIPSNIIDSYIVTGVNYTLTSDSESVTVIDGDLTVV